MVEYDIRLPDGRSLNCTIDGERKPNDLSLSGNSWTELDRDKCSQCPLNARKAPSCPLALDIQETLAVFRNLPSSAPVDVIVKTQQRWYFRNVLLERALVSMFGFLVATSSCPILRGTMSQRKFHLPFLEGDEEAFIETCHQSISFPTASPDELRDKLIKENRTRQEFLKRCENAIEIEPDLNSLISHLVFVFSPKNDNTKTAEAFNEPSSENFGT